MIEYVGAVCRCLHGDIEHAISASLLLLLGGLEEQKAVPLRIVMLVLVRWMLALGRSVRYNGLVLLQLTVARGGVGRDIGLLLQKRICPSHHLPHVVGLDCHDRLRPFIVVRVEIVIHGRRFIIVAALVHINIRVEDLHHAVLRGVIQPVDVHIGCIVYSFIFVAAAGDLEIYNLLRFVLGQEIGA